jgi:importin subunit beta-1
MTVLQQACQLKAQPDDLEMIDYVNLLREGILEAYTGIFQGFKADGKSELLLPFVEEICRFLNVISADQDKTEAVSRAAVGLLGDIADSLGKRVKPLLSYSWVDNFIQTTRTNRNYTAATKEVAKWTKNMVKNAVS